MNKKQMNLLMNRFIFEPQKYRGMEPPVVKQKNDVRFCTAFFGKEEANEDLVKTLLTDSISNKNEKELDLLLMLIEHFNIAENFNLMLAELLVQPWHHFHDRIAGALEFHTSVEIIDYLYKGAFYSCDNLEYESDYRGFNRKCLYALAKIGTNEAKEYIKQIADGDDAILSGYAKSILKEYNL